MAPDGAGASADGGLVGHAFRITCMYLVRWSATVFHINFFTALFHSMQNGEKMGSFLSPHYLPVSNSIKRG